jgi:3-hydroxyisobutyrate dehydrogenase-like beta-hydroxyacid dehydrogenase
MVDIGFIGLGHMGFPMARRQRNRKRNTAMMVKDVRLYVGRSEAPVEVAEAVARRWVVTLKDGGADSDFTPAIKPIERAAGVTVGGSEK